MLVHRTTAACWRGGGHGQRAREERHSSQRQAIVTSRQMLGKMSDARVADAGNNMDCTADGPAVPSRRRKASFPTLPLLLSLPSPLSRRASLLCQLRIPIK